MEEPHGEEVRGGDGGQGDEDEHGVHIVSIDIRSERP